MRLQGVVTILELAFLVAFVVAGLARAGGNLANLDDRPPIGPRSLIDLLFALVYISYGYTGWNAASYLAGEIGDAPRRLPRAILLGTSLVMAALPRPEPRLRPGPARRGDPGAGGRAASRTRSTRSRSSRRAGCSGRGGPTGSRSASG